MRFVRFCFQSVLQLLISIHWSHGQLLIFIIPFVVVVCYWNPQLWFLSSIIFPNVTFLCISPSLIWWLCLDALSITVEWHIKNNIILNTRFVMTGHNKYQIKHFQWTPGNRIKLFTNFQVLQDWTTARKRQKVYEFKGINTSKFSVIFI